MSWRDLVKTAPMTSKALGPIVDAAFEELIAYGKLDLTGFESCAGTGYGLALCIMLRTAPRESAGWDDGIVG